MTIGRCGPRLPKWIEAETFKGEIFKFENLFECIMNVNISHLVVGVSRMGKKREGLRKGKIFSILEIYITWRDLLS